MTDAELTEIREWIDDLEGKSVLVSNLNQPMKDNKFGRVATNVRALLDEVQRLRALAGTLTLQRDALQMKVDGIEPVGVETRGG